MSRILLNKGAAPSLPAAGKVSIYFNTTTGRLELEDGDTLQTYSLQATEFDKNLIINGGFDFAQRQQAGTLTSYAANSGRTYAADRWGMSIQTSSLQYQQIDTAAITEVGITGRYYGKFKQITGAGKIVISQVVEGFNSVPLRGRKVRIQVKMKRTIAAAMTVRLGLAQQQNAGGIDNIAATFIAAFGANGVDPTLGSNIAYIAPAAGSAIGGTITGNMVTCVLSGSWVNYGAVFTFPSDAKNLILLIASDSQLAINDELNVAEVVLSDGPDVIDWRPVNTELELERCQRFYCKTFALATAPAQNATVAGAKRASIVIAGAVATSWNGIEWEFPVRMRQTPGTITFYNPSAANAFVRNITRATDATVTAAANQNDRSVHVNCTGLAAWVVGDDSAVQITADAEI